VIELGGQSVPGVLIALGALALVVMAFVLFDLYRHDVKHLPKWGWALIIVLGNFPLGAIAYFVVGRRAADDAAADGTDPDRAAVTSTRPPVIEGGPDLPARSPRRPIDSTDVVVATHGLSKIYGDTAALDDVELVVPRGVTYGLIGPNGAGKTTMLSILAGLRRPTRGRVEIAVPRTSMGVLVDTPQFEPWLTAREAVDLARHLTAPELSSTRVDEVLVEVGLEHAADRRVGGFSRGMLQRLGLAGCLVGDPDILLLDEPSSALDPAGRREVLDLVGRLAHTKTVILSTHILSDVQQVADVVGVIDRGRLQFQGPLTDLLARTSATYAIHVEPPAGPILEHLRRCDWTVEATEHAPGRIQLVVSDPPEAERRIAAVLAEHGARLISFNPATDLETAFLELTS